MNTITTTKASKLFNFGTKAETLAVIQPLLKEVIVKDVYYFTVAQWQVDKAIILKEISQKFSSSLKLIIRSSALREDSQECSCAGAFESCLNVSWQESNQLEEAIQKVIDSYDGNIGNQVLVQTMVNDISVSGVLMTRNLEDGAPYYVINYDDFSGRTDSITGGVGAHKTVLIYHHCPLKYIRSPRIRKIIELAKALEDICGVTPMDIEFGLTQSGQMILFQLRPITLRTKWDETTEQRVHAQLPKVQEKIGFYSKPKEYMHGDQTILATMTDWNPAEMIGVVPSALAFSLYKVLITDSIWAQARSTMNYKNVCDPLMVDLHGRPYIDVRASFNSFLPSTLNDATAKKLVSAWLTRLDHHPDLHDKIEFDIVSTCLDFTFDETFNARYPGLLTVEEKNDYRRALAGVTREALNLDEDGTLSQRLNDIDQLAVLQEKYIVSDNVFEDIQKLMKECQQLGTLPFSVIARHAFIVESLLRSAVQREAISAQRVKEFKMSFQTITGKLMEDMESVLNNKISKEDFIVQYGHLRPGTYDITSLSYANRIDLFKGGVVLEEASLKLFTLTSYEQNELNKLLEESGFDHFDAYQLLDYARKAIIGREYGKFIFTRNVSRILERVAFWADKQNFSREQISHLSIQDILNNQSRTQCAIKIKENKEKRQYAKELKLCYIIRDVRDLYIVPLHRNAPNFIGQIRLEEQVIHLDVHSSVDIDLSQKIVCIENADPGFDWIFTKGIKGLITKYGGANSHMAIRCAEFGLPAAIGCGESTFDRIVQAGVVELNGAQKIVKPLYHDA